MLLKAHEKLLKAASEATMDRVKSDRKEKATRRVKPLLTHLEDHLYDPELTVATLMRDCGVRDNSLGLFFSRDLHESPSVYIRHRRLETGAPLLEDTDLKIWQIADLLGFASASTFGARFKEWSGMPPTKYRKAAREAAEAADSREHRLQAVARKILQGEAEELDLEQLDFLSRCVDELRQAKAPYAAPLALDGPSLERGLALTLWEKLRHLPPEEQKALVRQPYGLRSTALFDVLREKSREEGRKDRQAGVHLAELAIASLDGIAAHLTADELANRKALGMAWLANALRLALDFPASERTIAKARKRLPEDPDLEVVAEISHIEGELLLFQSKFEEALELKDQAVELFRSLHKKRSWAEALLTKAIAIACCHGSRFAIPDFVEAAKVAEAVTDPHLTACIHQSLLTAYAVAGDTEKALQQLPVARLHCANTDDRSVAHHIRWAESFIARQEGRPELAEELLSMVRSDFASSGEILFVATVDLDLADLFMEHGRESEAVSRALDAMPVFDQFDSQPEGVEALVILGDIAEKEAITSQALQTLRSHLRRLGRIPSG